MSLQPLITKLKSRKNLTVSGPELHAVLESIGSRPSEFRTNAKLDELADEILKYRQSSNAITVAVEPTSEALKVLREGVEAYLATLPPIDSLDHHTAINLMCEIHPKIQRDTLAERQAVEPLTLYMVQLSAHVDRLEKEVAEQQKTEASALAVQEVGGIQLTNPAELTAVELSAKIQEVKACDSDSQQLQDYLLALYEYQEQQLEDLVQGFVAASRNQQVRALDRVQEAKEANSKFFRSTADGIRGDAASASREFIRSGSFFEQSAAARAAAALN